MSFIHLLIVSLRVRAGGMLLVVALLVAAGCKATEPAPPPAPPPPPPINMAEYEDFDPSAYADEPPAPAPVEHDVPPALLDGKATATGTPRTVQGYRIQIYSAQDKQQADERVEEAMRWWRSQRSQGTLDGFTQGDDSQPPVYLFYRQPYYRVRVGNFATRAHALRFLRLIETEFPSAFIVPDTVTVRQ